MKAIFSVVTASAAMMRSPSFSRSVESSTTIKLPFSGLECQSSAFAPHKLAKDKDHTERLDGVLDAVEV